MARSPRPITVVRRFIDRINSHDVDAIVALLTPDHRFVDSLGSVFAGRETLRIGWTGYFRMVPDYQVRVERMLADGNCVIVVGTAGGTYSRDGTSHVDDGWETPAAWLALVTRGLLAEWRVFADNEPIRRRMREGREQ